MIAQLKSISDKLLLDEVISYDLAKTVNDYKGLIISSSNLDISESEHQENIKLENGIAIGLSWAASCLDDTIRTQKFIRGTKLAIDQKLKEGKKPVHLLYAGTGPFATLILPLLSHFSSEELQLTLLEINPKSIENVTRLIHYFGFENQVCEIRCADALKVILPNTRKSKEIDIVLSETMQHALQNELQVPITCHLLNQLSEDAILIPQSIDLELVKLNDFGTENETTHVFGELMKVDAAFLREQHPIDSTWAVERTIHIPKETDRQDGLLAISTSIQVFENIRIEWNESGLTVPKLLAPVADFHRNECITLRYSLVPEPGFKF